MPFVQHQGISSVRQFLFFLTLIAAGFAGNYFHISLFYGSDFVFGSIAVLLILRLYGIFWGVIASVLVGSYLLVLWNHPYSFVLFILETLVVGLLLRRTAGSVACLDGLYWLVMGMPLAWLFYTNFVHYDSLAGSMLALKLGVNGYANALVVALIIDHTPLKKWAGFAGDREFVPLQQMLNHVLLAFVVFPSLVILQMFNQSQIKQIDSDVYQRLNSFSNILGDMLEAQKLRRFESVNQLALIVEAKGIASISTLQQDMALAGSIVPDLGSVVVGDETGRVLYVFADAQSVQNTVNSDASYADSKWFKELKARKTTVASGVFQDKYSGIPSVSISAPVFSQIGDEQKMIGFVASFTRLSTVQRMLESLAERAAGRATVVDRERRVIASSVKEYKRAQDFAYDATGERTNRKNGIYLWQPAGDLPPSLAMRDAYYALEKPVGNDGSRTLILETSVKPFQASMQRENRNAFLLLIGLALLTYLAGAFVSRRFTKPLLQLSRNTADMRVKVVAQLESTSPLPESSILEVNDFVGDFNEMAVALKKSYGELNDANERLESEVADRTSQLSSSNDQLRSEIRRREQSENELKLYAEDLRRTADTLSMKEREQATLLDNLPDMVWHKDRQSRFVFVNRAFEAAVGMSSAELRGKTDKEIFAREAALACCSDDQYARDQRETLIKEKMLNFKNLGERVYQTTRTPLYNLSSQCVGTIGVFHDITERKRNEENLTRTLSEMKDLKFALDQHSIVSIADVSGNVVYANDKFVEISGYSQQELLGCSHRILNSGYHTPEFWVSMWADIAQGKVWQGVIRNRNKQGEFYWVDSTIVPFLDEYGLPYQYVSIRTDFTARKHAEEAMIQAKDDAEQANRAKSEFLSRMSHELRTPLNAILGFAQFMEYDPQHPLASSQMENLQHILRAGWHLLGLINEVLDLSRIESGNMQIELVNADVGPLVSECIDMVAPLAAKRNIHIYVEDINCQHPVLADHKRLKQVLINLLSNAVKYNVENGDINVACSIEAGNRLRISVADTGAGLSPENQKLLFTAFTRMEAEKSGIEGTGIGLVISKRLVELMGGSIGFHSEPGKGSTFWVALPLAEGTLTTRTSEVATSNTLPIVSLPDSNTKQSLLVIDDNIVNLGLVEQVIRLYRPDLQLLTAMNAHDGLALAQAEIPDVILLDMNLPDAHGLEVLAKLREAEETRLIPVLAFSGDVMPESVSKAMEAGFVGYLEKPVDIQHLLSSISSTLENVAQEHA